MKKPSPQQVKELIDNEVFQWFVERLVVKINELDTVRDADEKNISIILARKMAIELVENLMWDLVEAKTIRKKQKEQANLEPSVSKILQGKIELQEVSTPAHDDESY